LPRIAPACAKYGAAGDAPELGAHQFSPWSAFPLRRPAGKGTDIRMLQICMHRRRDCAVHRRALSEPIRAC
jgi:hypothetical protein